MTTAMGLIVQKFGGTSLADPALIRRCAMRALETHGQGHQVVVVVSAMGHTTDHLIDLARQITDKPSRRELDMLMSTGEQVSIALMTMSLHQLGADAVSYTGAQLGIVTTDIHSRARIRSIDTDRLQRELDGGRMVVAAGFQGVSVAGHITTLGRGGSDTTAVAIAAALGVGDGGREGICEIYTDVDGVYTCDPRQVPEARKLSKIAYDEMLELAAVGAGVMHPRAIIFGRKYGVPIHVRHSAKEEAGTMIVKETGEMERVSVIGCALSTDLGRVGVRGLPNKPGAQATLFEAISRAEILVDDIMQLDKGDTVDLTFTVESGDIDDVRTAVETVVEALGQGSIRIRTGLAKVSVVGVGMRSHSGVAAEMFRALGEAGISICNITTSEIRISCLVPAEHGATGLRVVHDAFGLGTRNDLTAPVANRS